jgi:hypothetical protein
MNINILEKMNKVPGGLIIIPLLVAIFINTFAPRCSALAARQPHYLKSVPAP